MAMVVVAFLASYVPLTGLAAYMYSPADKDVGYAAAVFLAAAGLAEIVITAAKPGVLRGPDALLPPRA